MSTGWVEAWIFLENYYENRNNAIIHGTLNYILTWHPEIM